MMGRRKGTWLVACVLATVAFWTSGVPGSPEQSESSVVTAAPGDIVHLPCYSEGSVMPSGARWLKDGIEVEPGGGGQPRVQVLSDGSLHFPRVAEGDEGVYRCEATLPGNMTWRARVLLQVASGPENVSLAIVPSTVLPNGTLVAHRGSSVSFHCAAVSYPSQSLAWSFAGTLVDAAGGTPLASAPSAPWLDFRVKDVQPEAQGFYMCLANNTLTHVVAGTSAQLLVYYASDRHPECSWLQSSDPTWVHFNCAWPGCYPDPELRWSQIGDEEAEQGRVLASEATSVLRVSLNRSLLAGGQTLRCAGHHSALAAGREAACSFTLEAPRPHVSPLMWAQEGNSVTLACSESASVPPAITTWSRVAEGAALAPGPKYALSRDGATYSLTIANVSRDDVGTYFCRSENALALRRAEVYLSVTAASDYTGVIVGIFVAALIVGLAAVTARLLFANRHRICLGRPFGSSDGDTGDVLSLVDSDEEQIFQAVPRLPPVTDPHPTTLVQVHRLPSGERENTGNPEAREEPPDLVTL
ncbi:V-set and immunoglobulin domain-containing protein 10 [Hippocampus zosterae]|uniref:V-set and immunoglobulin domain-containing protein 10 n=1 Tax=Hippocampus zosterae TaxID=109293 RepID=UPI00223DEAFE|nr:V-set and immunoglobulin domain-containing protein 10 [Hippocampus zosterae]XP_051924940.1 V-set and immunoglobulin domain-containing protein 10 [Hippocampus zosterae]XP_051924941.1 V-set and immunoglobulin domain-containing protein 10 [Hippocampus zosterae]